MKFHNKINLFSLFVCSTTIIINILFPKSIYALIIFLFMEMTGVFILYFWDKTSSKKNTDYSIKHHVFEVSTPIIWGLLYFLGCLSINRFFNTFTIVRIFENLPLMFMVALESSILTFIVGFAYKIFTTTNETKNRNAFLWQISISVFVLLGLLTSIILGPLIQSYHTDAIMHIHLLFTIFICLPVLLLLGLTSLAGLSKKISSYKSSSINSI